MATKIICSLCCEEATVTIESLKISIKAIEIFIQKPLCIPCYDKIKDFIQSLKKV